MSSYEEATAKEPVCPACQYAIREHPAGDCLDVLVAQVMRDQTARPYSTDKSLAFEILDRVEGDLISGMGVAIKKVEGDEGTKLELNRAVDKWWVKIYYGDRGSFTYPVVDRSAALAVSRAVVIADHMLKLEAGPEETVIK